MIKRSLLLAALVVSPVLAAPMTIVFTGNATGSVGSTAFTNQPFTITFTTDNASVTHGTACCANDYTTPSGTSATADFGTAGTFQLAADQAVFVNQTEFTLGIWHYDSPDYLTVGYPDFGTYTLSSSIGPIEGTTNVFPTAESMNTSKGPLVLQAVSGVKVQVTVGTGTQKTPVIEAAAAAYGTGVSQNTWIAITGTNLAPAGTPVGGALWSNAASFANGLMPDSLNGVSVKVNGKTAYVYFYCAASTEAGSVCTSKDQINALTPIDPTTGPVDVVVSVGSATSAAFKVTETPVTPSIFKWDGNKPYVTATHPPPSYSILGPTNLFTGLSTPASVGETVVLWASGFGLPKDALTPGSANQFSPLPELPTCEINNAPATVTFAGVVSPGLYQINVTIPNGATDGDNSIKCTYQGVSTQDGLKIT
ncbi:MAG TPA: hypothetical protein VFT60_09505, partial [Bryobacteraceae bacterium]|nr:hypothetical protein [Bryobacteraceae bacterium]